MRKTEGLVSVIVPTYNSAQTIRLTVESIQRQTHEQIEILIYDDGSTDQTTEIVQNLAEHCDKIQLFNGEGNKGAGHARNFLLSRARGQYIAFLDSDDVWHEEKLAVQIDALRKAGADICITAMNIYSESGELIDIRKPSSKINFLRMHFANLIPMSSAIVNAGLNGSAKMPMLRKRQDYAYWLRLLKSNPNAKVVSVDRALVNYLKRSNSLSSSKIDNLRWNFLVFKRCMDYGIIKSTLLVLLNSIHRLFRR